MKGIGIFVLLLLTALGVATYVVTRPPDRDLDAEGKAWVAAFERWASAAERDLQAAQVAIGFSSEARNARVLEPLRSCASLLARVGLPPEFLDSVLEAAQDACGRAEYAVRTNDEFGFASLATTRSHLNEAEDRLVLARHTLRVQLGIAAASSG